MDKYGVHPQLVADTHQYLYRTLGISLPPPIEKNPPKNKKHIHNKRYIKKLQIKTCLIIIIYYSYFTVISG